MGEKLTIVIPQWQGGGQDLCTYDGALAFNENYLGGAADATVEISTADIGPVRNGILGYDDILESMQRVNQELEAFAPSKIFTVGGGCDADTPCAAWLNKVYDGDMAVVYIDSHGDLNTPESSESHLYYGMSLRALAGETAPEYLDHLASAITPAQLITCGARNLDPAELEYKAEHQVTDFTVAALEAEPGLVAAAIAEKGFGNVYIHIDLDVLDPSEFALTPLEEPDGMTKKTLLAVLREIKAAANVVGFGLLEYSGTMEDKDDPFLAALAEYGMEV